jgi:hypothetical protein
LRIVFAQEVSGDAGSSVRPQTAAEKDDDVRGGPHAAPAGNELAGPAPRLQMRSRDRGPRAQVQRHLPSVERQAQSRETLSDLRERGRARRPDRCPPSSHCKRPQTVPATAAGASPHLQPVPRLHKDSRALPGAGRGGDHIGRHSRGRAPRALSSSAPVAPLHLGILDAPPEARRR